jgi:hypothetical protein
MGRASGPDRRVTDPRKIRLATYNVEWFNALFDDHGALLNDAGPSSRYQISRAEQTGALGIVFTALNADGIMIIEAPDTSGSQGRSTVKALENFARAFGLRQRKALIGFVSGTEQEIAFLYDPDVLEAQHDPRDTPLAPRFDRPHRQDLNGDGVFEALAFSKPPLEVAVRCNGADLRLIGVHSKSKSPHGARGKAQLRRIGIENRRKQLAQSHWLRLRAVAHLAAGETLMIMGDFNDGPGMDEYEVLFGRSSVDDVLGARQVPALQLYDPHAAEMLADPAGSKVSTSRFWLPEKKQYFEALLDYIMVSPRLRSSAWKIWHPLKDAGIIAVPELSAALLQASDHFPVSIDITL